MIEDIYVYVWNMTSKKSREPIDLLTDDVVLFCFFFCFFCSINFDIGAFEEKMN